MRADQAKDRARKISNTSLLKFCTKLGRLFTEVSNIAIVILSIWDSGDY